MELGKYIYLECTCNVHGSSYWVLASFIASLRICHPNPKASWTRIDIAKLVGNLHFKLFLDVFTSHQLPHQKFLQAQSKVGVLASIGFAALIVHILELFVFVRVFKWGVAGAAVAYDLSAWVIALAQLAYVVGWCKDGWRGLSWLAFKDIWGFVRLSIASAVMLCLEIWYFMTIIVLTDHLDDPVIVVGSLSICVRVSNELGSGHPKATKYSVVVTCIESLIIGVISAIIILVTKDYFAIIFTDSEEMRRAVSKLAYLLCFTVILNSIQPVISGVAVGGGWQGLVAYINLFCYYIVGLPLGFVLGYKTRLHVQVEEASERMKRWGGGDDPFPTTAPSSSTNDIT
ncbi:hypothetical protein K2173_001790 [Erythroxylum novogranatense]|uniref:Uncharacterized protein n=1 Tax=Erythroxylum novogranatense TaxID=1862640 RepID=A0AAV8SJN6_9ROSI|nr:hypothetical protein K2173_001790 [Erythroxylum novogranatense]